MDVRHNSESFERIPTIAKLSERLAAAAGKSTNIEALVQRVKLGGNGPIMAHALSRFGVAVTDETKGWGSVTLADGPDVFGINGRIGRRLKGTSSREFLEVGHEGTRRADVSIGAFMHDVAEAMTLEEEKAQCDEKRAAQACAGEGPAGSKARTDSDRHFNPAPRQVGSKERDSEDQNGGHRALMFVIDVTSEDEDWPVPEVERVGHFADADEWAGAEEFPHKPDVAIAKEEQAARNHRQVYPARKGLEAEMAQEREDDLNGGAAHSECLFGAETPIRQTNERETEERKKSCSKGFFRSRQGGEQSSRKEFPPSSGQDVKGRRRLPFLTKDYAKGERSK